MPPISKREREVLGLFISLNGCGDKVIARLLDVSPGTIKVHMRQLRLKLNANNRTHLAVIGRVLLADWAAQENLIAQAFTALHKEEERLPPCM